MAHEGYVKRFGVRYGLKLKKKVAKVEAKLRSKKTCPYCNYHGKVKRVSAGIWYCEKCGSKFTGKAYEIK